MDNAVWERTDIGDKASGWEHDGERGDCRNEFKFDGDEALNEIKNHE